MRRHRPASAQLRILSLIGAGGALAFGAAAIPLLALSGPPQSGTVVISAATGAASGGVQQPAAPAPAAETFATHCATCHGTTGKGDGPASYLLFPKPRDFTSGVYRFKSTYDQAPPTKAERA